MKKNWFYLFALICSVALFTACSDDDEDTSWMEYQEPTEYTESMQTVTVDGDVLANTTVTFAATSANTGSVMFDYMLGESDFQVEVALTKTEDGYDFAGSKELRTGYTVNVAGSVTTETIEVSVVSTGYASIDDTYYVSSGNLVLTLNGTTMDASSANVSLSTTSANQVTVTLNGVLPGIYDSELGGSYYTMENLTLTQEEGTEVYNFSGTATYGAATYTVEGTVSAENILSLSVDTNIDSPVVGTWSVKMSEMGADVIASFSTNSGSITLPDALYGLIPAELQIPQTVPDAQVEMLAKMMLGQYVPYLKSIDFKATGDIDIVYTDMNAPEVEQTLSGLLNYLVVDEQLLIVPNITALMGMIPMSNNTKAVEFDPSGILVGAPIPFNFSTDGSSLSLSVDQTVITPLVNMANALFPSIGGMFIPDQNTLNLITSILSYVNTTLVEENVQMEIGLNMVK